ncbi:hypothetical protein [Oscillatoria sp. FACHB-1407]|nr:hypothetical protein [Oscillatoria sp. FACHB-1407]
MDKRADKKHQDQVVATSGNTSGADFNFDLWASAVKRQMIASLRKRGDQ